LAAAAAWLANRSAIDNALLQTRFSPERITGGIHRLLENQPVP
jgi:hypothetical protein